MRAVFISDAHLKSSNDPGYRKCLRFLRSLRGPGTRKTGPDEEVCDFLVIAGDFFDFWFAKEGRIYPAFEPVIERLFQLKREGIRICLCEGNHDFYLADYFTGKSGFEVYPGDAELDLDGRRAFVSHGDTVDKENWRYLALRRFLRSPFIYVLHKHLPLKLLWRIARFGSEMSQEMSTTAQERLEAAMHRFAADKYREGLDAVILGHCHRAVLRQETIDGRLRTFALLGDWIVHDSFLLYDNGLFTMNRFGSAA